MHVLVLLCTLLYYGSIALDCAVSLEEYSVANIGATNTRVKLAEVHRRNLSHVESREPCGKARGGATAELLMTCRV